MPPSKAEIDQKAVRFGPKTRQKLLVLDMDETMLHTKFYAHTGDFQAAGLQLVNGVLEFNALISGASSTNPGQPETVRLNVKIRQHLEDVL